MHFLLLLLLSALLTGCVTKPMATNGKPDLALQQRLTEIQRWDASGKLAVRSTNNSESARLQWLQNGEQFDIQLSGPAGLKATRIHGTPNDVNFEQGEQRVHAASVEELSQQLIGWPLPAAQLTWWLRGLPAPKPSPQKASYAAEGWLAELEQDGWTIHFSDPQQPAPRITLPGRIDATRGELRITLIIKTWQLD
ncbi:MAG: lipoprotein insertase outer membrane protein LolB [Pseudomonadales bacterium]